jgi:tetratricopeptide (TPR) repeat protein
LALRDVFICLVLLLATLGVYSQVAHFDFVNYDDPDYTTENLHIRGGLTTTDVQWAFTSSYAANWFPLTWISHMLDRKFFGSDAGRQHLTNLVLHMLSTLLLFALFKRMTGWSAASGFVAFVFALHPLHIESVAWIAERKDVLCALFWFLTMWAYLNYVARPGRWRYVLVAVAFGCALMSKSMAVTLPFALLLLDVWPLRRFAVDSGSGVIGPKLTHGAGSAAEGGVGSPKLTHGAGGGDGSATHRRDQGSRAGHMGSRTRPTTGGAGSVRGLVIEKLPLIALAIAVSIVTFLVQRGGGAVLDEIPLGLRIANALNSYVVYLVKFFWPANLAVFYPYEPIPVWQAALAALILAAITAFAIRRRSTQPYLAVGWFWYLGTLLPVIGLIQVGVQARADRYTYIPAIGIAIMLAWGFEDLVAARRWLGPPVAVIAMLACAGWATVTWRDLRYWRDSNELFQRAIAVTEGNYVAYSNLGAAFRQAGRDGDAIASYERALSIKPHFADAQDGLGETLTAEGRLDEGMAHLSEAVRLEPESVTGHVNLGAAFSKSGRAPEAADQYRIALQLNPESPEAHCGLGVALAEQNRLQEALAQLFEAVRIKSDYADGYYNLGRVLGLLGRTDEAMTQFVAAIRLQPENAEAHYNLGTALATRGRMNEAADQFRMAVYIKPDYVNARFNYASALANLEHYDEAIPQFQAILRLKPDFQPARESLAQCIELRDQAGGKRHRANPASAANPDDHAEAKPVTAPEAQVKGPEKNQATTTEKSQTHRAKRKRTTKT